MPVKSLVELATATCIKNIRHLESIGDYLPYENVRQILLRVENAEQLRRIELNSPQVDGRTGEIWLKLIERDFPLEYRAKAYKPKNSSKWYRVWEAYKRDHDASVAESERKLKNAFAGLRQDKEKNTSRIVERNLLPRRLKVAATRRGMGGPTNSSTLNFTSGSRTKTSSGASVMRRARREAREIASIHGALSKPVRNTPTSQSEIKKAPQSMINDYRRAAQPSNEPKYKPPMVSAVVTEYEARATFLSDSDEDEEDDDEDMFGEPVAKRPRPPPPSAPARPSAPKGAARSAAASLLKTRPAASRSTSSTSRPAERKVAPASSGSDARRSSSSLPGGIKSAQPPSRTTQSPSKPSGLQQSSRASAQQPAPPKSQASPPPLSSHVGPSTSPPLAASASPQPRKRKAVDIFMRPKKRPN